MKIIGFVYEIDATCINVRAFSLGAFQKKQKNVHLFRLRKFLQNSIRFSILFLMD